MIISQLLGKARSRTLTKETCLCKHASVIYGRHKRIGHQKSVGFSLSLVFTVVTTEELIFSDCLVYCQECPRGETVALQTGKCEDGKSSTCVLGLI